jgi:penicillin-binding protein 2
MATETYGTDDMKKDLPFQDSLGDVEPASKEYTPQPAGLRELVTEGKSLRFSPQLVLGLVVLLGLLSFRLADLQVVQGARNRFLAEGNRIRSRENVAPRGAILASGGETLVGNTPSFALELFPAYLPKSKEERERVFSELHGRFGIRVNSDQITSLGFQSTEPIELKSGVTHNEAIAMELKVADLPGIVVATRPLREYSDPFSLSHLTGYIGKISRDELEMKRSEGNDDFRITSLIGKTGLEQEYEDVLRGVSGKSQVEVDARGRQARTLAETPATPGKNLLTFIDANLSKVAGQALSESIKAHGKQAGVALAIDPKTGGILTLVSLPSFDPRSMLSGESASKILADPKRPLLNRAISGVYPTGSTIKPVWASAALQEGTITAKTQVVSTGGFSIGDSFFPDWKSGGHGTTNLFKAIAESVNTYFYAVSGGLQNIQGLGVDRMKKYAENFGIGEETGIDLPSENEGFFPDPDWKQRVKHEPWYPGDTYHLGIGQGDILATPLELLRALTATVNGGELVKPRIVRAIADPDGKVIQEFKKEEGQRVSVDQNNLSLVREAMRQTVVSGSARSLVDLPVPVGGKTGTAQFGTAKRTHAWFFGFAPYDDPQIAVLVLVEGGGEGSAAATPVAKKMFQAFFGNP